MELRESGSNKLNLINNSFYYFNKPERGFRQSERKCRTKQIVSGKVPKDIGLVN
jgi:hypothetical protein